MTIDAQRVEILLAEKGMTKKALSQNSGIPAQNISVILRRGTCLPPTAGKLAVGLGVRVADILKVKEV